MEYTHQLQELLSKHIHEGIHGLWEEVRKTEKKSLLKRFQEKLCFIPNWSQELVDKEYSRITKSVSKDYLDKLLEAVFLSNIKILSVVKLNNSSRKIDVNVPDTKHFIHKCYIETAREFYSDPYMIEDRSTHITNSEFHSNYKRRFQVINDCIEKTIRNTIPMEEILNKYLSIEEPELQQEPELHEELQEPDLHEELQEPDLHEELQEPDLHEEFNNEEEFDNNEGIDNPENNELFMKAPSQPNVGTGFNHFVPSTNTNTRITPREEQGFFTDDEED
jgi:hypothetical protein